MIYVLHFLVIHTLVRNLRQSCEICKFVLAKAKQKVEMGFDEIQGFWKLNPKGLAQWLGLVLRGLLPPKISGSKPLRCNQLLWGFSLNWAHCKCSGIGPRNRRGSGKLAQTLELSGGGGGWKLSLILDTNCHITCVVNFSYPLLIMWFLLDNVVVLFIHTMECCWPP